MSIRFFCLIFLKAFPILFIYLFFFWQGAIIHTNISRDVQISNVKLVLGRHIQWKCMEF